MGTMEWFVAAWSLVVCQYCICVLILLTTSPSNIYVDGSSHCWLWGITSKYTILAFFSDTSKKSEHMIWSEFLPSYWLSVFIPKGVDVLTGIADYCVWEAQVWPSRPPSTRSPNQYLFLYYLYDATLSLLLPLLHFTFYSAAGLNYNAWLWQGRMPLEAWCLIWNWGGGQGSGRDGPVRGGVLVCPLVSRCGPLEFRCGPLGSRCGSWKPMSAYVIIWDYTSRWLFIAIFFNDTICDYSYLYFLIRRSAEWRWSRGWTGGG